MIFCSIRCRDAKRIGEALKIYEVSGGEISGYICIYIYRFRNVALLKRDSSTNE